MAAKTIDAVVIGAGHNGLIAAAYAREGAAGRSSCSSARERAGGILRDSRARARVPRAGHRPHGRAPAPHPS